MNASSPARNRLPDLMFHLKYGVHSTNTWFYAFVENFDRQKRALILDVTDKATSEWLGTLPLDVEIMGGTHYWSHRRLVTLGKGISDFFPIPCQMGKERDVSLGLIDWLDRHSVNWDLLHLDLIPESSAGWREFVDALNGSGFSPQVTKERRFYKIDTDASWDEYEINFLHPKLADLRNRKNRMTRAGIQPEVRLVERGILAHFENFLSLYRQRRETSRQPNVFETYPAMQSFLEAVIRDYEKRGWVRLSMLLSGETVMAYQLDWLHNGVWYHYMPAFDEHFAEYSPGKMLLYETIKMAFADPNIHEFNFMRGESTYKTQFANQSEAFISIDMENPRSLRLKATRLATHLVDWRDRIRK